MEWTKNKASEYYNYYMPWIEDKVLGWRGENKTSYTAKQQMNTDITGVKSVHDIQGGVSEAVGGQLDNNGLLGGVAQAVSTEGINRQERDEFGVQKQQKTWTDTLSGGALGKGK